VKTRDRLRFSLVGKILYGLVLTGLLLLMPVLQSWEALPEGGVWGVVKLAWLALVVVAAIATRRRLRLHFAVVLALLLLGGVLFALNQGLLREPPTEGDARNLRRAAVLLASPEAWDRSERRSCGEKAGPLTLYCALRLASLEEVGGFRHRRPALQMVRTEIGHLRPQASYEHRLSGFNSDSGVTFADLHQLLAASLSRVEAELRD
jgi:hypothetical protein